MAGGTPPKFWAVGKSSSRQKFFILNANFEAEKFLFWGNLGSKLKF